MTEVPEQQQNSQLQSTPKWKQFPHESMQKLVPYLQGKVQSKDVLDHDLHSFAIMRHGKTANIDNEWDSQKDEHMGLSPSEFNFETSTIRTTAEEIVAMWYKKLKVYSPGDTLRNKQTKELLIQFVQQLNPEVQILEDPGFDANLHYFHARKQFTADVYQWLLAKDYLAPGERTMIEEYQGKKHVLGANRVIRLSKATQQQLQKDDPTLFAKVDGKYEESYSAIIDRAGQWVDALRKYVAAQDDKDALHLVVAYRTTLQATDQVMKSNKEVADMDSFFDTWFAQMQMSQCDDQGNSIHALTMNSRDYDPATYERDVSAFHAISPEIALEKSPYENMSLINNFLLQTEAFLEYCLSWPQPNKKILRRQNLLTRALKQPIPPVMARRIIETILNKYDTKDDKDGETKTCIDGILRAYIQKSDYESDKLFKLLYGYRKINDAWKGLYVTLHMENPNRLTGTFKNNSDILLIEKIIEKSMKLHDQEVETVVGKHTLEEVYVPQELFKTKSNEEYTTEAFIDHILTSSNNVHFIQATAGSGKSFLLEKISHVLVDPMFLWQHNLWQLRSEKVNLDDLQSHELDADAFVKKFSIWEKDSFVFIFDALDEKSTEKISGLHDLCLQLSQKFPWVKFLISSRYFEENLRNSIWDGYGIAPINDLQLTKYIDVYKRLLPTRKQAVYTQIVQQVFSQYRDSVCSPLLLGMITLLVDNRVVREKLQSWYLQRSDIYREFLYVYGTREEGRENIWDPNLEKFYDIAYDEPRILLLQRIIEETIFQPDALRVWDRYEIPKPELEEELFKKMSMKDYKFLEFCRKFCSSIWNWDINKNKEVSLELWFYEYGDLPAWVMIWDETWIIENPVYINKKQINDFLLQSSKIWFTKENSGWFSFAIDSLHKSFYDYIWYTLVKDLSIREYINWLKTIFRNQSESLSQMQDVSFRKDVWYDNLFDIIKDKRFFEYLPSDIKMQIEKLELELRESYWDSDDAFESRSEREKELVKTINIEYRPAYCKENTRILKNIHEYLIFRLFDSKKELIPIMKGLSECIDALRSDKWKFVRQFLSEVVWNWPVDYDFLNECDHIDEKLNSELTITKAGIDFVFEHTEQECDIFVSKILDQLQEIDSQYVKHMITQAVSIESPVMCDEYRNVLHTLFHSKDHNECDLFGFHLNCVDASILAQIIQLKEIIRRWGDREDYLQRQRRINRTTPYALASEFLSYFSRLYDLTEYLSDSNAVSFTNELDAIVDKVKRASHGEKISGSLYWDIDDVLLKYDCTVNKWRTMDIFPAGYQYMLFGSRIELLTNKYFGFA